MPPSRRRNLGAQPPTPSRRPRVAGLRRPSPVKRVSEPTEPTEPTESTEPTEPTEAAADPSVDKSDAVESAPSVAEREATTPDDTEPEPATEQGAEQDEEPSGTAEPTPSEATDAPARPSPRRKARDRGTARPTDADQVDVRDQAAALAERPAAEEEPEAVDSTTRRRVGYPVLAALIAATLVLAGLAVFFKIKHSEVSNLVGNTALVDVASTAEVKQAMEDAAEQLLSVNYKDMEKTERAADRFLGSDEVRKTYDGLMGDYRKQAAEQKIVVTTTAVRSGVVVLDDDSARVMVYVDQVATRAGNDQPMGGPAALWFEAERQDGTWKVSDLDVYGSAESDTRSGSAPTGAEPSSSQAEDSTEGN
ncbi:hypothetical protein [Saccharomonospora sp. NB11]|uniref:hypothetical protein n=1 Tax=Saccharomonospora sp. NB11 TaxID=1642298 RepID=UPI0018D01586|nr:hypothetical protein [Saccharomonospora sp. NB11]